MFCSPLSIKGQEAVAWLHENLRLDKKDDGIVLGQHLQNKGFIINLLSKTEPFNEKAIYKFSVGLFPSSFFYYLRSSLLFISIISLLPPSFSSFP